MNKLIYFFSLICTFSLYGQNTDSISQNKRFDLNVDIVSRYLWRGLILSPGANIQPYATLFLGNFSLCSWASYATSDKYAEVDFYLNYTIKNLTLTLADYYTEDETDLSRYSYFNLHSKQTNHALEGSLVYTISDGFPLKLTAATFFYGNDRDSTGKNNYSTYLELLYPINFLNNRFDVFAGATPAKGYYAPKAAVVNVGLSFSKTITLSDKLSVPLSASVVTNPYAEDIFFVVKLTL